MVLRQRVFCFITRNRHAELLVFTHRDFPEAGVQVPGGGIEPGESPLDAALREAHEEAGLAHFLSARMILDEVVSDRQTHAYVCHLTAPDDTADAWEHPTNDYHDAEHSARGEPLAFRFSWIPVATRGCLADPQDRWLGLLTGAEAATWHGLCGR